MAHLVSHSVCRTSGHRSVCTQVRGILGLQMLGHDTIDGEAARLSGAVDDWKLAVRFDGVSGTRAQCFQCDVELGGQSQMVYGNHDFATAKQRPQHSLRRVTIRC